MQSLNLDALLYYPWVRLVQPSLAIPHYMLRSINEVNPNDLFLSGIRGVIFDKDNTITLPYDDHLYPGVKARFLQFRDVFNGRIAIMSNSAGTKDDQNYREAEKIEKNLDVPVLRHNRKKPGGINAVRSFFGKNIPNDSIAMFGDRIYTDIVFGNRYGMLTFHVVLLGIDGDNKTASRVRDLELLQLKKWQQGGLVAPVHRIHTQYSNTFCYHA